MPLSLVLVAGVPEHAHCEMCQTPVEVGQRRCGSKECEERFEAALRAKKRGMYMFIGVIFLVMMISFFGRGFL
jgi:predicted nucleic acid-binding Zn ribbon protein